MTSETFWPLVFAFISPFAFGVMNIVDKYVVSRKAKNPFSFAFIAGMINLTIGIIIALFLNWKGFGFNDFLFSALAGLMLGSQFYIYYFFLSKEDASSFAGFVYFYPIVVAMLSFFFLHEVLSLISYIGVAFVILGIILLSIRMKKIRLKVGIWLIIVLILIVALYEFFVKVATGNLPPWNGLAISYIFIGIALMPLLLHSKSRKGIHFELRNVKWALLGEFFTFIGVSTTYLAMTKLPATIFSSISGTQPLAVLALEYFFFKFGVKVSRDHLSLMRWIAIILICVGVFLLYSQQI